MMSSHSRKHAARLDDTVEYAVLRLALSSLLCFATLAGAQSDTAALPLRALVVTALRNNLDLRSAALLPRLAGADLRSARGRFDPSFTLATENDAQANDVLGSVPRTSKSAIVSTAKVGTTLPAGSQLSLSLSNSRLSTDPFTVSTSQPFQTSHASSLSLTFAQPLLRGFGRAGTYGLVDAATTAVESSRSRYERSADVTIANVERAYWLLREAESNERVGRQSVTAARTIYDRNVALKERDVATALDVLTSERVLATRESQLLDAARVRVDAADRLLFLVYGEEARGSTLQQSSRIQTTSDSVTVPVIPTEPEAVALALAQRGDAIAAASDVEAGRLRAEQSRRMRLPGLDLIASYGYGGTAQTSSPFNYGSLGDQRSSSWSLNSPLAPRRCPRHRRRSRRSSRRNPRSRPLRTLERCPRSMSSDR